jgi:glycine cleavage system aminomethyltransferase T
MPAIYVGDDLKAYRQWLPANGYEGMSSLGGSLESTDIRDYYLTPYDIGYGPIVKFDHDFPGRAALEKMVASPRRKKVTLAWNADDAEKTFGTMFRKGENAKYIDFPSAVYSTLPYDKVTKNGKTIGVSTWSGYSYNERSMLSLAMLEVEHVESGTEVTLVWGESGGGTKKSTVEPHRQVEIRATVGPVPFSSVAREAYRPK